MSVDVTTTPVDATTANPKRPMLESIAVVQRFLRAFVRRSRAGEAGLAELAAVADVRRQCDETIDDIARHLLAAEACSYREVGVALGITRQAAERRYRGTSARPAGGQRSWLR